MRKFILTLVVAMMAVFSANAQVATENSKMLDNFYVGVDAGVSTFTTHNSWMQNLMPTVGIRVGKNITPVFGIAVDGTAYLGLRRYDSHNVVSTAFKAINTSVLGTVNFSNLIWGYKGAPRNFEVTGLFGLGWFHTFGSHSGGRLFENPFYAMGDKDPTATEKYDPENLIFDDGFGNKVSQNKLSSKAAINVAYNFGSAKQWQVYVEPSMTWIFGLHDHATRIGTTTSDPAFNINNSMFGVSVGVVYKFKNINGTHNFRTYDIGAMNAEIDQLRAELAKKPKEVVRETVKVVEHQTGFGVKETVYFAYDSDVLDARAKETLDKLGQNGVYVVDAYASSEGSTDYNLKLSQRRADAVKAYLEARGARVESAVGHGVQFGTTTGRVAIVKVK